MLTCLRVKNFAIIDELEVDFVHGMNVVTGETGAGKSILVRAMQLVLGARGTPEVVRTGAKQAEVEALFDLGEDEAMIARLVEAGLASEEPRELLIRRVIAATGRSRAYINGRLTTASQLSLIARGIADISSQHQHHSLADASAHLGYLDAYAQLDDKRIAMGEAYAALVEASQAVDELRSNHQSRVERADLLRFQLQEIETLAPTVGEDDALATEQSRLRHAARLVSATEGAERRLYADDGAACELLSRIATEVRDASDLDASLVPMAEQLEGTIAQLEDVASDLGRYAREVALDPARLREVEERLDALDRARRKYGGTIEAVLAHQESAAAALSAVDSFEPQLAAAEELRDQALAKVKTLATELSKKRKRAAKKLGSAISQELRSLGMGDAKVVVEVAPREDSSALAVGGAKLTRAGIDSVEFLIAPNRGERARPLKKIASGGELSRAMLAIKRVLAGLGPAGLYVFDEVDSGVGGAIAEAIGRKLADVATHNQVLCITHLPQIAVFGAAHFRVQKETDGDRTRSDISRLDDRGRLEEVARMVGGASVTKRTREAAKEMLELANVGVVQA